MICIGFSEGSGPAELLINLGSSSDAKHRASHCFLRTEKSYIHAIEGYGVIEEAIPAAGDSRYPVAAMLTPPAGVDLAPAVDWARKCIGQPYDMRRNVLDGIVWFLRSMFRIRFVLDGTSVLRRFRGTFRSDPPSPTQTRSKNCVELLVGALQNCPSVPGRENLDPSWDPSSLWMWCEKHGWLKNDES